MTLDALAPLTTAFLSALLNSPPAAAVAFFNLANFSFLAARLAKSFLFLNSLCTARRLLRSIAARFLRSFAVGFSNALSSSSVG